MQVNLLNLDIICTW